MVHRVGRAGTKDAQDRDLRACGRGYRVTQSKSGRGKCYLIPRDIRQRTLMQLSQVSSHFSIIIISCYFTLVIYSPMCLHTFILVLMLHIIPLLWIFMF